MVFSYTTCSAIVTLSFVLQKFHFHLSYKWKKAKMTKEGKRNLKKIIVYRLLCFRHLSESHFLLGDLHGRSKFANFCHDSMQNNLS